MQSLPTYVTEAFTRQAGRWPTVVMILGRYGSEECRRLPFTGEPDMTKVLFDILADPEVDESWAEGPARVGWLVERGVWGGGGCAGKPAIKGACACAGGASSLAILERFC